MRLLKAFDRRTRRELVSNFIQTSRTRRAYVPAIAGSPGVKKHENCADRAADGECPAAALWRDRANCFLSHGWTGPGNEVFGAELVVN